MDPKETRGRKPKDVSYGAAKRGFESRKRFKEYFISLRITQAEMADICGLQVRHVRRLLKEADDPSDPRAVLEEAGKQPISHKVAENLEKHSGIAAEYWTGETDARTRDDYTKQTQEKRRDQQELDDITERIRRKYSGVIGQYESLFSACGYRYECLADPSSVHDMIMVLSGEAAENMAGEVWHRLTAYKDPSKQYHFTRARFNSIIRRLQDTIAFECSRNNENASYEAPEC